MAFITVPQLKTHLAAMLHKDEDGLPSWWDPIVSAAVGAAYSMIVEELIGNRGWSLGQLVVWSRGFEFNLYIALYTALVEGADAEAYSDTWPEKLRWWRDELKNVSLIVDGVVIDPVDGAALIGHGRLDTSDDEFVRDTTSRGEVTVW